MAKFTNSIVYKILSLIIYIALFMWMNSVISNSDLGNAGVQSTVDANANKNTVVQEEPSVPNILDDQIDCFLSEISAWLDEDEYYSYAVTDYDQDGNLELARTIVMGSGGFSKSDFFEYNNGHLEKISFSEEYEYSQPDPSVKAADCYYDPTEKVFYYYLVDTARNGSMQTLKTYYLFSFGIENKLSIKKVKAKYIEHDNSTGEDSYVFYDADKNEIEEERFNAMEEELLPGSIKKRCSFKWIKGSEMRKNTLEKMYESWAGFKMEDK